MAYYAELNQNNEVIYVVYMENSVITDENEEENDQLGIDHLHHHHGANRRWVRTSYTGRIRGKFAGIGDTYNEQLDRFISPKPYNSWNLNETTGEWESPLPMPELTQEQINNNQFYFWDETEYQTNNNGWVLSTYD